MWMVFNNRGMGLEGPPTLTLKGLCRAPQSSEDWLWWLWGWKLRAPQEMGKLICFYSNNMLLTSKVGKLGQSTHTSVSNSRFNMKRIQFNPGESDLSDMSTWDFPWFFHDFVHGFSMVSKMLRLEGVHHRQPNATWEGNNFDKVTPKKGDQKARNITILVYSSIL